MFRITDSAVSQLRLATDFALSSRPTSRDSEIYNRIAKHSLYRSIKEIIPRIWEIRACEKRTEVAAKFEIVAAIYHFENIAEGGAFSKVAVENMTDCQNWFVRSKERANAHGLFYEKCLTLKC